MVIINRLSFRHDSWGSEFLQCRHYRFRAMKGPAVTSYMVQPKLSRLFLRKSRLYGASRNYVHLRDLFPYRIEHNDYPKAWFETARILAAIFLEQDYSATAMALRLKHCGDSLGVTCLLFLLSQGQLLTCRGLVEGFSSALQAIQATVSLPDNS